MMSSLANLQIPLQHKTYFCDGSDLCVVLKNPSITHKQSTEKKENNNNSINYTYHLEVTSSNELNDTLTALVCSEYKRCTLCSETKFQGVETKSLIAAVDALFNAFPTVHTIQLDAYSVQQHGHCPHIQAYRSEASTEKQQDHILWLIDGAVHRETFYQNTSLWLQKEANNVYPIKYGLTDKFYHPMRPQKPTGIVYQRYIPWLQATLSFRVFSLEKDLERFSCWMNDPVVDYFWEESGEIEQHREYIQQRLDSSSHTLPLICCIDDHEIGYFETYWAKEDRIASYYPAEDFHRGWHVLIGDENYRGKNYVTAWMPSISHYLLIDDPRTTHVVIEPRIDNEKMKRSLAKCGYAHVKTFDFPHKTAMLGMLSREHFFRSHGLLPLALEP